jgi:hypothetical protein
VLPCSARSSTTFLFNLFSTLPSLSRSVSHHALSTSLAWTHPESSVGLAAAKNLDDAAGLKPEPSIYHSGLNTLDCRDGDHSSESRRIGQDTIMNSSSAPSPCRCTTTTLTAMLLDDCDSRGFALVLLPCVATRPIKEMPHNNTAGCCLASPRMNYV